jgi:hypothetical protein
MLNRRGAWTTLVAILVCFIFAASASAQDKLTGTIDIKSKTIAIGIGVSWGDGVLNYKGKSYKFKVDGLSVIDLSIASVSFAGEVYNLAELGDFSGNYSGGSAGIAVAGGVQTATLTNQKGVKIKLKAKSQGIQLKLAPEGLKIQLKE